MSTIFDFWSPVRLGDRMHPADGEVLKRVDHGFDLNCLPSCFAGRLRSASIVLLYLSPGWSEQDPIDADTTPYQERILRQYKGDEPFPGMDRPGTRWIASRTACFGTWADLRDHVSVLNIGAYHSKSFNDAPLLAALPSSRASISFAQDTLFPAAIAGKRVVICLRASRFWGLQMGERYGEALFAPEVTRGGYMLHGKMRDQIVQAVRRAIH